MSVIFHNVAVLVCFSLIGWLLARFGIVRCEHAGILSKLLVWVFLPAKLLSGFSRNCTVEYLSENYTLLILSVGILAVVVPITYLLVLRFVKDKYKSAVIRYSLIISNYGYMGYALVESIYGEAVMLNMMLFALPISIFIYTEGYRMLTGESSFSLKS